MDNRKRVCAEMAVSAIVSSSLFDLESFQDHVGRVDGSYIDATAFWANLQQVMAVKLVGALIAAQERLDFIQLEIRIFQEVAFSFDNVKTKLDMVSAVTGERIEADADVFDT